MIEEKTFDNLVELNTWVDLSQSKVISIQKETVKYDTGLPLLHGGSFKSTKDVYKVWVETL